MTKAIDLTNAPWRKSSYSGGDNGSCVEVADGFTGVVPVRDSKNPGGPALLVSDAAWQAFVGYAGAVRSGASVTG